MDSGLGGLSVAREIHHRAPEIDLIYFADSAHCPYGLKSVEFIRTRVNRVAHALIEQGATLLVLACNTASAAGLEWLRARLAIPVVGMEPAVKPAASSTQNGRIGILATSVTLAARRFENLIDRFGRGIDIHTAAAPDLVTLVESGKISGGEVETRVESKLNLLKEKKIDTLVLGCTHFPFLLPVITKSVGQSIRIIDTGPSVAAQTLRVCRQQGVDSTHAKPKGTTRSGRRAKMRFFSSNDTAEALRVARILAADLPIESDPKNH